MYNVIEKIGTTRLVIYSSKNKKLADWIARQLKLIHKNRIVEVSKVKKV